MLFCAFRFKANYLKTRSLSTFGREASLQRPKLPPPPRKVIGKPIKSHSLLCKVCFPSKMGCSPLKKGMFPSQKRCSVDKISASYMCLGFFSSSLSTISIHPLKISDRTLEKIPCQARTASLMFFFSCQFLLRLVVLVTDHTRPLESLNKGDRVVVPWYLVHTLVKPAPKSSRTVTKFKRSIQDEGQSRL